MSKQIITGIDIGTHQIKVVVAEHDHSLGRDINILGTGIAESKGMRHGYVVNSTDTIRSVRKAIRQAEKAAGLHIKNAHLAIGGVSLEGIKTRGAVIVSRADNEVTDNDVESVHLSAENKLPRTVTQNKKVIHTIPLGYTLDEKKVLGRPQGLMGNKLEVEMLFITCLEQHIDDLIEVVEEAGVIIDDVVAAPVAAATVTLSKTQKIAGCVLANIGAETVSIIVYEDNIPISLEVFPVGSNDITNDLALGLQISLDDAEKVKTVRGRRTSFSRQKIDEIMTDKITDIFLLIKDHLEKIGKDEMLPAGIIISGGGSGIDTVTDLARATLKLPSQIAEDRFFKNSRSQVKDATWSVARGLCVIGLINYQDTKRGASWAIHKGNKFINWIKQFLP